MDTSRQMEPLVEEMLHRLEDRDAWDAVFRKDIEDLGPFRIQWDFAGTRAYQFLSPDSYAGGMGEAPEPPDITFTWPDEDEASRFLEGERFVGFSSGWHGDRQGNFTYRYNVGKDPETGRVQRKAAMLVHVERGIDFHPFLVQKLPMFRDALAMPLGEEVECEEEFGAYIPINESLGMVENEILPKKIFEHFFGKASNILMLNECECRVYNGCTDHDHTIGCMHLGDDTLKILNAEERGRFITAEEALEVLNRAVGEGLIPLLGRSKDEARGFGIEETGHFMSMCFCCKCCCVNAKGVSYGSSGAKINHLLNRMDGVRVEVDEESCNGCELCLEMCTWNGLHMVNGMAVVDQERCLGCGRCEDACPLSAIMITIEDDSSVFELIDKLESYVDVAPQGA